MVVNLCDSQRVSSNDVLGDFEICNRYDIDNTGLVCKFVLSLQSFFFESSLQSLFTCYCSNFTKGFQFRKECNIES